MYVLISRRGGGDGEYTRGVGGLGLEGRGGRSMLDCIELRLLLLKVLGGEVIENPDSVLPFVLLVLFDLLCPPPGVPSCGAVLGRWIVSSRRRGTLGGGAAILPVVDCLFALVRCISSSTFGPLPATG